MKGGEGRIGRREGGAVYDQARTLRSHMPKESDGEGAAHVLDGPEVVAPMQTLCNVLVKNGREAGVLEVTKVEGIVLEYHDVGYKESALLEAALELWIQVRGYKGRRGNLPKKLESFTLRMMPTS